MPTKTKRRLKSMKPDEAMHAAMEEVDLDPCDLYTDLGSLIVEGRVPGLTDKGYGEGPHCCPPSPLQSRHQCDPDSPQCQKYEQILKHMLLLWKNGIPMTIEVLLHPGCCSSPQNTESVPEMSYLLLEQWTLHMLPRRVPDASISPRGLIQAVRSFLYFSQLCAWFSLTGGKSPKNVHYRVCVPGEAFSSKFSTQPDCHVFPVANVGRNSAMKVTMKSHPRCGEIPRIPCDKHSPHSPSSSSSSTTLKCRKGQQKTGGRPRTVHSPADSMLGDSLLDPPHSLCMYPKRYQSPSRCGSPSIEVPEHLMFGKSSKQEEEMPRQSRPQRRPVVERFLKNLQDNPMSQDGQTCRTFDGRTCRDILSSSNRLDDTCRTFDRRTSYHPKIVSDTLSSTDRPECHNFDRRTCRDILSSSDRSDGTYRTSCHPKMASDTLSTTNRSDCLIFDRRTCQVPDVLSDATCRTLDRRTKKSDILARKNDDVLSYCCIVEEDMKNVPQEEMEEILERLREKNVRSKKTWSEMKHGKQQQEPLSHLIDKMKIDPSNFIEQNKESKRNLLNIKNDDSKNLFRQALQYNKESSSRKFDSRSIIIPSSSSSPSSERSSHFSDPHHFHLHHLNNNNSDCSSQESHHRHLLENQLKLLQSSGYIHHQGKEGDSRSMANISEHERNMGQHAAATTTPPPQDPLHPKLGSVNIKKCGTLLMTEDCGTLTDEREIWGSLSPKHSTSLLKDMMPPFIIPSAEEKAFFRRSLDSARSLVFHQRSGLPLTSSPAPVRKCGTCFDFDSSLTSVSAIKRALFEKELEEVKNGEELSVSLSTSAPASIVSSSLLGTFEESVLNGRLEPVSTVEGFTAEIGASGSFCPRHITLPVTVFFYTLQDMDKVTSPYMGHINLRDKDYHIPKKGTVQVTLFNPHGTVVKMFVVRYDLCDMPVNSQTFLRQRTLYMPADASENDSDAQKWLRYLIHLRFMSSKSGRIYLHTDVRVIIFRKSDLDAATVHGQRQYELRSFTHAPLNPKFSSHKPPPP